MNAWVHVATWPLCARWKHTYVSITVIEGIEVYGVWSVGYIYRKCLQLRAIGITIAGGTVNSSTSLIPGPGLSFPSPLKATLNTLIYHAIKFKSSHVSSIYIGSPLEF